ncbi:MAG: adenylate/guanylate cyclase domain-containing protein [Pseudomonadales bacterium]|nr:adenylate/guanylate cyclase domain-containing protein [Pseudomonadales bacterium]
MRMVMLIFSFMPLIFLSLNASFKTSIAITASAILVYEITAKLGIHFFAQYKPNFPEQFYELAYIPAAFFVAFITHEVKKLRDRVSLMKQQFEIAHRELEFTHKALEQAHNDVEDKNTALELLASKLAKYLSPQIYASIFSGEKDVIIETYKKNLTVFFSDIVGFSKKTEAMELEQLPDWLNQYLDEMAAVAIRYGGTLDKFIGDAVMVFFGDPQTEGEENDAVKCVKMAIEMQKQAKKIGMNIRIGINSGECLVGNFGSDLHMEYTIIGSAVNLAARLESHCEAGEILISQASYRLVKDQIACVKHGGIQVKGFDQSVMTYGIKKGDDKKA